MYTLITGASSGIGKAFAYECASRGMNLLLIALPGEDLCSLSRAIQEQFSVKCHCHGIDLSLNSAAEEVHNWVKVHDFNVNILINNVGIGSKGAFEKLPREFYQKQINLNVLTTCLLTRLFVEDMKLSKPAYILNMGSMGGFFSLPEKTVYSATKAFIYSFSKALRLELEGTGVSVSVVCPGGIDSNANTIASNKALKGLAKASILQPCDVAKESIDKMLKGYATIIPGKCNRFIYNISRFTPSFIQQMLVRKAFSRLKKQEY